jgi:hypothetical protein
MFERYSTWAVHFFADGEKGVFEGGFAKKGGLRVLFLW